MRAPSLRTGIKAKLPDEKKIRQLIADSRLHGLVVTDEVVHAIHQGWLFRTSDVQNVNSATQKWLVQTPDSDKRVRLLVDIEATGEMEFGFYEGSTHTGNTELDIYNQNRNNSNNSDCSAYRGATGGSDGTLLFSKRTGATGRGSATPIPGIDRGFSTWELKPNEKYVISVTTYNDIYVSLQLEFTEFIDKG